MKTKLSEAKEIAQEIYRLSLEIERELIQYKVKPEHTRGLCIEKIKKLNKAIVELL